MNRLKIKKRYSSNKTYAIKTLVPILLYGTLIGLTTGIVIWGFTLLAELLSHGSAEFYTFIRQNTAFIPLLFVALIGIAILSWFNTKHSTQAVGSGIPYIEGVMRGLLPLDWFKGCIGMMIGSLLSFVAGLPLGCEGPSVFIGGCIGFGINQIGSKKDESRYAWRRQSVTGGAAAGFAVAFNAPLAGIIFALEEGHKRFSPMILLPAAASVISATLTSNLLTTVTGHGIANVIFTEFATTANPTIKEVGFFALLGISTGLFAVLYSVVLNALNSLLRKIRMPRIAKFIAVFILTGVIGLFFSDALGSGSSLIRKIALMDIEWKILLALLILKVFQVLLCASSEVPGGHTIPMMALGALLGGLMANLFIKMGMDERFYNLVVLISMCAFLGGVIRAPIMSIVLVVEMTRVTVHLWAACLTIALAYFIVEFFRIKPIFDHSLGNILARHYKGKHKKLIECEVEIEHGSFAVNRCVRDILWPANTLVIKVKKTDAEGNIIYKMDDDGEHVIHAGDRFIIQAETSDFENTYRELCYIIKQPGYAKFPTEFLDNYNADE